MYSKIIDAYIKAHKSNYQANYCYHSCDRVDARTFKFHYYVRDRQLLQMNIYLEIHLGDEVEVSIKESIHEQEQWAIACDALERIRAYTNRKTTIAPEQMDDVFKSGKVKGNVSCQDMINLLNHIEYHEGKNHDSIYSFYAIFMPYLDTLLSHQNYKDFLMACNLLFDEILSETIWQGFNIKYIDQEHILHHAYVSSIISMLSENFEVIEQHHQEALIEMLLKIFHHWRFAFAIYASLEKLTIDYPEQMMRLLAQMNEQCHQNSLDGCCLVYDLILSLVLKNEKDHRESIIEVLKLIMTDILSFANPEDQRQTGLIFLKMVGFDLLMEIFEDTKDSYVYSCFNIEDIPEDFHPFIQRQLETSLQYWAGLMKDRVKRMEAIDQISNINTLLIEHFNIY